MLITPDIKERADETLKKLERAVDQAGLRVEKTENNALNRGVTPLLALALALELVEIGH